MIAACDQCFTHVPLLAWALQNSTGSIIEFGMGHYSSNLIHALAKERKIYSADNNLEWVNNFNYLKSPTHKIYHIEDWDLWQVADNNFFGLVFIDHAPEYRRMIDIERMKYKCEMLLCHDTENESFNSYHYDFKGWEFKYTSKFQPAFATLLSHKKLNINGAVK